MLFQIIKDFFSTYTGIFVLSVILISLTGPEYAFTLYLLGATVGVFLYSQAKEHRTLPDGFEVRYTLSKRFYIVQTTNEAEYEYSSPKEKRANKPKAKALDRKETSS